MIKQFLKQIIGKKRLLFLNGVDAYQRYKEISLLLPEKEEITILDVGGANARLSFFTDQQVYFLDSSLKELNKLIKFNVCADGCSMPFRDNSFDYVTSVACLEHLPKFKRRRYQNELKRVCKKQAIVYTPLGRIAADYDRRLLKLKRLLFIKDRWTEEHLKYGLPEEETLLANGFKKLKDIQNADIWLAYMLVQSVPLIRFLSGILYMLLLKHWDNKPPFIGAIFEFNKY